MRYSAFCNCGIDLNWGHSISFQILININRYLHQTSISLDLLIRYDTSLFLNLVYVDAPKLTPPLFSSIFSSKKVFKVIVLYQMSNSFPAFILVTNVTNNINKKYSSINTACQNIMKSSSIKLQVCQKKEKTIARAAENR